MWKALWKKWTVDKPALFGDWLWDVFVVQLAAWLDRITLRQLIAFIPVVILILAYCHRIPLPPELILVGDVLAYIDVFSALFLLGILSRAATVAFVVKEVAGKVFGLANNLRTGCLNLRHRREAGAGRRKKMTGRFDSDSEPAVACAMAWT